MDTLSKIWEMVDAGHDIDDILEAAQVVKADLLKKQEEDLTDDGQN